MEESSFGYKKRKEKHSGGLPFIGYGAALDFILNDITSLRLTSLVSGFER